MPKFSLLEDELSEHNPLIGLVYKFPQQQDVDLGLGPGPNSDSVHSHCSNGIFIIFYIRQVPVISGGTSNPTVFKIVGATSARIPTGLMIEKSPPARSGFG